MPPLNGFRGGVDFFTARYHPDYSGHSHAASQIIL